MIHHKKTGNSKPMKQMKRLLFGKRAVSVVLSTMILTAGVIAAGIAVLYWAYSWGNIANSQYANATANSMNAIKERIGFEYIAYSGGQMTVYLINCGKINDVTIARIYVWDSSHDPQGPFPVPQLKDMTGNSIANLDVGDEGYFQLTDMGLSLGAFYTLRIVTTGGRNFDQSFATPQIP